MGILVEEDQTAAEPDPPGAPPRDADADAWLDWRDKEKRAGRWWRLEQIAKWSDHTIAQLKYKSSLRKPRGTPKPNPEKRKKLKKLTE